MKRIVLFILTASCFLAGNGCGPENVIRPDLTPTELLARRAAADDRQETERHQLIERNIARIKAEYDANLRQGVTETPVVNLLVISGGGDWGAFGAGFLKGWAQAPAPMVRPTFDAVTGVSTGALIAPFAFLGDDASIEKIVHLYRDPQENWVRPRNLIAFLSGGASYAEIPGLENDMKRVLDIPMIQRIAAAGADGRILAINTTNIDTSEMCVWDMVKEAEAASQSKNPERFGQLLLASAAVPGAFPPRLIDGTLYIDGGITGNIIYAGERGGVNEGFLAHWREKYPDLPPPRIHYWVIFNNEFRWPPTVVQPKWSSVIAQAATASTRSATLNSLRQLFLQAQLAKLRYNADVQVHVVAVPDGWTPPKPGLFVKETMNALADMGERMGADPASWRTTPP